MCNIWGLQWPSIPFPQDLLFPWENGVEILKAPPQFAGVAGERTATFWQLKEATNTKPTRKNCAARSGNARVLRVGLRQSGSLRGPCSFPSSLPWFICTQVNCKAFWVSLFSTTAANHAQCPCATLLSPPPRPREAPAGREFSGPLCNLGILGPDLPPRSRPRCLNTAY